MRPSMVVLALPLGRQHLRFPQVREQFGDDQIPLLSGSATHARRGESPRTWARFAAAGVLALAMFLAMVRWLAP